MIFLKKHGIVMKRGILTCQIYTKQKGITDTLAEIDVATVTNLVC